MRKEIAKLKENLDERMGKKSKYQIIGYELFSVVILTIGVVFLIELNENWIVQCLLGVMESFFIAVIAVYFSPYQLSASLRENNRKKEKLFKNGVSLKVIPYTLDVYREIVYILKEQKHKQSNAFSCYFQDDYIEPNKYSEYVNKMIENNEITLTAELIDEVICIFVYHEGNVYDLIKTTNFIWFKTNFSIV